MSDLSDEYVNRNTAIKEYVDKTRLRFNELYPGIKVNKIIFDKEIVFGDGVSYSFIYFEGLNNNTLQVTPPIIEVAGNVIYEEGVFGEDFEYEGYVWVKATRTLTFNFNMLIGDSPYVHDAMILDINVSGDFKTLTGVGTVIGSFNDVGYIKRIELGQNSNKISSVLIDHKAVLPFVDKGSKQIDLFREALYGDIVKRDALISLGGRVDRQPHGYNTVLLISDSYFLVQLSLDILDVPDGSNLTLYINGSPYVLWDNQNSWSENISNEYFDFNSDEKTIQLKINEDVMVYDKRFVEGLSFGAYGNIDYSDNGLVKPNSDTIAIDDGVLEVKNPLPTPTSEDKENDVLALKGGVWTPETMFGVIYVSPFILQGSDDTGNTIQLRGGGSTNSYLTIIGFTPNIVALELSSVIVDIMGGTMLQKGFEVYGNFNLMNGNIPVDYIIHRPIIGFINIDYRDSTSNNMISLPFKYRIYIDDGGNTLIRLNLLEELDNRSQSLYSEPIQVRIHGTSYE